jgi:hypothetical protein
MRFHARHVGSGVWGVFDAGVMGWRATALSEDEAHQQAADLNVIFSQYGQRDQIDRLEVKPPIEVESATWSAAGELDYWIKERHEWWGLVRDQDGDLTWIRGCRSSPCKCFRSIGSRSTVVRTPKANLITEDVLTVG